MNNNCAVISIIVPIYNVEKYLKKCLDSIINQTYKKLEIILINDGSTDSSGEICDEYAEKDSRIKVIHKKNGGVSSARNIGLETASGEYVTFVDADDWIESNMYEEMLEIAKQKEVDVIRCGYCKEYAKETVYPQSVYLKDEKINLLEDRQRILRNLLNGKMHAYLVLFLIKRDKIVNISRFNTNLAMREDFLWAVELIFLIDSMYILNQPYYHYFQNPKSVTNAYDVKRRNMESMVVVKNELDKILKKYDMNSNENQEIFSTYFLSRVSSDLAIILYQERKMEMLSIVMEEKSFQTTILKANKKELSIMNKIFFFLYKRKKKKALYFFCLLKEFLRKNWIRKK